LHIFSILRSLQPLSEPFMLLPNKIHDGSGVTRRWRLKRSRVISAIPAPRQR
jgi:hypothetical protein